MPHRKLQVSALGMIEAYEALLATRGYFADAAQMTAASALQSLYSSLLAFKVNRNNTFKRLLVPPKPPKGCISGGASDVGKVF